MQVARLHRALKLYMALFRLILILCILGPNFDMFLLLASNSEIKIHLVDVQLLNTSFFKKHQESKVSNLLITYGFSFTHNLFWFLNAL